MLQVSKLLHSKVLSTNMSEFSCFTVQFVARQIYKPVCVFSGPHGR